MTQNIDADLCIIGAGSAGLSLAAGAAQLGRKVVLIEKGKMGGDCLNYGCVPSKALIAAGAAAQSARDAAKYGVTATPSVDYAAVMDHVAAVIAKIEPHDSQERFEGFGCTVLRDSAKFVGAREVVAGDKNVSAKHFVIATGSSPFVPPIEGLDSVAYLTNETVFANRTAPDHLIVLGGGPIGIELAQAHARLGVPVTLVEGMTILNREDPEAVDIIRERLTHDGVTLIENVMAQSASNTASGGIALSLNNGNTIEGSHLLVAVGRRANTDDLGLEAAGVETNRAGIIVDDRLRTTNKRIFAAGDVTGGKQFTHVAGDHASTLVRNILFKSPAKRRDAEAPHVTYCDPELASIGLTEKEAQEKHPGATTVRWSFDENDRAQTEMRTDGFLKAFIAKNGKVIGATIVGKGAGDEISVWAYAIANNQKIRSFTNMIAPYPTRSEISKRAGGAYYTPTLFSPRTKSLVRLLATFD